MFDQRVKHSILTCFDGTIFFYLKRRIMYMSKMCELIDAPLEKFFSWICMVEASTGRSKNAAFRSEFKLPDLNKTCLDAYTKLRSGKGSKATEKDGTGAIWKYVLKSLSYDPIY